jgi:exodeoxyribonuclease V alpha subunit
MTATLDEIKLALAKIIYAQDGFAILLFSDRTTAKGNMLVPKVGLEYTLRGKWIIDPKYGRQFQFEEYETHLPKAPGAIAAYLAEHCDYVGPVIAARILQAFGERALEVLKSNSPEVCEKVKGLTPERAQQIAAHLREIEDSEAIELELKEILTGTRISKRSVSKIKAKWKHQAAEWIKKQPYDLIEQIEGVGFSIADEIAKRVGFAHDSPERIQAGIKHVLTEASWNGHTCLPDRRLIVGAAEEKVLNVPQELVIEQIKAMVEDGSPKLISVPADSGAWIYLPKIYRDERYVAKKLGVLLAARPRHQGTPKLEGLQEDQVEAVKAACGSPVLAIVGAPGVGKSFTIRRIIESFPGARVKLCAPTGKAARRMVELSGKEATTIHKLLVPMRSENGGFEFGHGEDLPVEVDMIVCDEVSMVSTDLAASLLRAISPGTRLILVGDTNQLPSVGPGNVLASIIASKVVPSVELTKIKRQDPGMIIINSHRIRDGLDVQADNGSKDFFILDRNSPEEIRDTIVDLLTRRLAPAYGVDPVKDIQLICALREKTILGCAPMNAILQAKINKNPTEDWTRFKLGDKVIQLKNEVVQDAAKHEETSIANGDVGFVEKLAPEGKCIYVRFQYPDRLVKIQARDNHLDLAYAVTVHKFQGDQRPIVIVPIHASAGPLLMQRPLLYTAISRAQRVCILVGQRSEIPKIISRNNPERRFTRLVEFLCDANPDREEG